MLSVSADTSARPVIGPIVMSLPAEPALSRVLRLSAAGLASLVDFSISDIEDVKIAVSEVLIALIEHGVGETIELSMACDTREFRISASTAVPEFDLDDEDLALCRTVLSAVCASYGVVAESGRAEIVAVVGRAPMSD